jgi:1-deoxyxylulose-5-phosphate synthase
MSAPIHVRIPGTALEVSRVALGVPGIGTALCGQPMEAVFDRFVAGGGNFFDTAHCYAFWKDEGRGLGASERALGQLIRTRGLTGQVVVATKGGHPAAGPLYPRPDQYLSPAVIGADIGDSLERLGVERLDLFLLHRDDPRLPVGEIMHALHEEVRRGRVRYVGVSNWSADRIAAANAFAAGHGLTPLVISQPDWNLAEPNPRPGGDPTMRRLSAADEAWHVCSKLPVMCYHGTASGFFASGGERATAVYDNPVSRSRLARCRELAGQLGCTPGQVALAWLLHQPFPVFPVVGTSSPDHIAEALAAGAVRLMTHQVRWLRDGA